MPIDDNLQDGSTEKKHHVDWIIMTIFFVMMSLITIVLYNFRSIDAPKTLLIVLFCFCLAMASAVVLFHFFKSQASVDRPGLTIGGAAAGFLIIFIAVFQLVKDPANFEDDIYLLSTSRGEDFELFSQSIKAKQQISKSSVEALNRLATTHLQRFSDELNSLASGRWDVGMSNLQSQVAELVASTSSEYFAVQKNLTVEFFDRQWTPSFIELNVEAATRLPESQFLRIFIVQNPNDSSEIEATRIAVQAHVDNALPVAVVEQPKYVADGLDPADLHDFVIFDATILGTLTANGATFTELKSRLQQHQDIFERLRLNAIEGGQWLANGAD